MFTSVESALKWAARVRATVILDGPSTNGMCGKPAPATMNELLRGLSPQEAHGQASLIFKMVKGMDNPVYYDYVIAQYCKEGDVRRLTDHLVNSGIFSGVFYRRGINALVLDYVGVKQTKRGLRELLRCDMNAVAGYRKKAFDALDNVHNRVIWHLEGEMQDAGLIELDRRVGNG